MSTSVTCNGSSFTVPAEGEEDWSGNAKVDGLLVSLANNTLQKSGGTFSLTSEVDFDSTAGLKALSYKSRGTNISTAGILRLANAESIGWRNAANSADKLLSVDSSDRLTYAGVVIASSAGVVPVASGGTNLTSYTAGDLLYASGSTTLSKLGIGSANTILASDGSVPSWRTIVNADISSSAAIAYSKLNLSTSIVNADVSTSAAIAYSKLNLTGAILNADLAGSIAASKLVGSDIATVGTVTSGTWSATAIAATKGGTGQTTYTTGDLLYASGASAVAKLGIGSSGQILKVSGGLPSWGAAGSTLAIASKTANYTVLNTDDVLIGNATGASSFTFTLPDCATNSGKVFYFKNKTTDTNTVTIARAGSDTIDGLTSVIMASANDELVIVSGGSSVWQVLNWGVQTSAVAYRATSDQTISTSATEVIFNTLDNQTNSSAYSTSTGRFTVIYPGRYQFIACLQLSWTSAPTEIDVWFQKNGAGTLYGHQYKTDISANKTNMFTVSAQLQLAAGDYVSAWGQFYTNSGTLDASANRRSQLIVNRIGN